MNVSALFLRDMVLWLYDLSTDVHTCPMLIQQAAAVYSMLSWRLIIFVQVIQEDLDAHSRHFDELMRQAGEKFLVEDEDGSMKENKMQEELNELQGKLQTAADLAEEKRRVLEDALSDVRHFQIHYTFNDHLHIVSSSLCISSSISIYQ